MSVELLPCPFCGATDGRLVQAFTRATETFAFWSVECLDCGVEVADDESQERADAAWNTRAPADLRSALEGAQKDRDTAQSAVEAWAGVCESLEAHLQDRVAMQDEANPAVYLSILRSGMANVQRDSRQIRASRWADYARQEAKIAALEAETIERSDTDEEIVSAFDLTRYYGPREIEALFQSIRALAPTKGDVS